MLVGLRPGDTAYDSADGLVFKPQDTSETGNIPYYEVTATDDALNFDLREYTSGFKTPVLILNSVFGPTDYTLIDRSTGTTVVSEDSPNDSETWIINLTNTSGRLRLTEFENLDGGWQAICQVLPLQV